ncbi:condensation domain-containing protein, partial [Cohnella silvisoli]
MMKPYVHLADMLEYEARNGKGIVFIHKKSETRMSYRELYDLGMKLAQRLHMRGWHSRDEVVLQIDDQCAFVVGFWGCMLGGFIPVPITTGGNEENRVKFQQVWGTLNRPRLLTDSEPLEAEASEIRDDKEVFYLRLDDLEGRVSESLGSDTVSEFEPFMPSGNDIAFLQFSSGSTGQPKGVILTHANLLSNMNAFIASSGTTDRDCTLNWLPLTHDMGLIGFHLGPIYAGMDQYLMQPAQFMLDPMLWLAKVNEHRITAIASPNFGYKHFLGCFKKDESIGWDLSCVKLIFNGAEPISADWAERFLQLLAPSGLKPEAMFPVYGMAEATLAVTFPPPGERLVSVIVEAGSLLLGKPVKHAKDNDRRTVTFVDVGYPVAQCEVAIRGDADNPLPEGTVGHILIRGSNVTRGYYNAPEASAGALAPGGWLRTGDVGFMQDGRLVITGRFKDIIFVRGQNVYPHDLEKRAEAVDGVGYGKVAACGAPNADLGEDEIVLFVQHRGKPEKFLPLAERLKRQLSRETGFDIGRVVPIRLIPRTTSGKIQRYKLAERLSLGEWDAVFGELEALRLAVEIKEETSSYATQDEHPDLIRLMGIWREALGVSSVHADDHFQESGGNSLKAAQALAGIRKLWGAELSLRDIFEFPTPRLLLERIRREELVPFVTSGGLFEEVQFAGGAEGDRFPASTAQKRMALLEQAEGIGCAYHIPVVLSVDGPLSSDSVAEALQSLTDRHETLRTSYHWEHGQLLQEVHSSGSAKVELRIFCCASDGFPKCDEWNDEELNGLLTPFDLSLPPLIRAALWTDEANSHRLALNVHHIASDGIGMNVLMQEFAALLNGEHLPLLKVSYKQFAVWEQRNQATKTESIAYWSREVANEAPSLNWPDTSIRPIRRTFRGGAVRAVVPSEAAMAWNRHARSNNGTISSLLLSLHAIILQRYCLQSEFAIGLLLAGRSHPDTQGMVGMFNNYIPVRMESVGEGTFREHWNRSRDKLWEALSHADVPYEKLIELSGRGTESSRNPLFDTMLIYHNQLETTFTSFEAGGCRFEQIQVDTSTSKLDLKLDVYPERSGALTCVWEFNELLFRRETVEKMARQFVRLAEWIAKDPDLKTGGIDLLSKEEHHQVVNTFNATIAPFPRELTLPELFRRQAEAAPDKLAASFEA